MFPLSKREVVSQIQILLPLFALWRHVSRNSSIEFSYVLFHTLSNFNSRRSLYTVWYLVQFCGTRAKRVISL